MACISLRLTEHGPWGWGLGEGLHGFLSLFGENYLSMTGQ